MAKKRRKRQEFPGFELPDDPFLLDDPGGSALDWVGQSMAALREAVRRGEMPDPWLRAGADADAQTERRRRKLQNLSLNVDDDHESVA